MEGVLSNIDADEELLQANLETWMSNNLEHYKGIARTSSDNDNNGVGGVSERFRLIHEAWCQHDD